MRFNIMKRKPIMIMLVGLPCSGKSTFAKESVYNYGIDRRHRYCLSTDNFIELQAKREGKTYNEVFANTISEANDLMREFKKIAIKNKADIVWDQTNLTVKSRRNKLRGLEEYYKIAICFEVSEDILNERLAQREGKTIPKTVIKDMKEKYVRPTTEEGFDEVIVL